MLITLLVGMKKGRNRVYESHFEPTAQYHIEKMTLAEIRKAQTTYIGLNKRHLFAIGIFQMIPDTLFGRFPTDNYFMKWLNNYRKVDEATQLFDKNFQQLTPLFFGKERDLRYLNTLKVMKLLLMQHML